MKIGSYFDNLLPFSNGKKLNVRFLKKKKLQDYGLVRMKYRDVITLFVSIFFILSLAYSLGVDNSVWFLPVILFVTLAIVVYKLWL